MKEIKTLADLEALAPRERDIWFTERLNIEPRKYYWALSKDGGKSMCFTADTAREVHDYLEQQLKSYPDYFADYKVVKNSIWPEITTTNDGIAVLKAKMINKGFWWKSEYHDGGYIFTIQHVDDTFKYVIDADNEIEATWKAAALALLGER